MRILFITKLLPPLVDGVGDYTFNLAKQFVRNGHEVYIICKDNPKINSEVSGMTILPIIKKWNFDCYKPIIRLIKEKKIDIVSLQYVPHGFQTKGLPFPLIKLTNKIKKHNVKLFTFCHEVSVEKEKGNIKRTLLSWLMQHISKRIIENSDYVATSIEYYRNMIFKLVPNKKNIPLIPIASNIPEVQISEDELCSFKKDIAANDETIISFFGVRNIQTSIDAINELIDEGYKLKVLIIGKTSNNFPKNLPNDTIKTGILNMEDIDKYFKITDIFILPQDSIYGCSFKSGSFSAALRNKLPIITAKGKMTSVMLENNRNILFTDFNYIKEIKTSILFLLKNKDVASVIGNNAYNIGKDFSWSETYKKYINILK
ncbi:glycosyltransferase family 4 protein [Bacteroides ilei]|uniref:glycosyltransferase family 4 protein n=1 Tax=Bacteroides ilei TaxID=1907658 RepID=UPI000931B68C|nr:glycosyltransferase family 4 protein [Bacteroides ilei]